MPKAPAQAYTDQQNVLNSLVALEAAAKAAGDHELSSAAERARRELCIPKSTTTVRVS